MNKEKKLRSCMRSYWRSIMHRCYNPKTTGYEYYGGRGIEVSSEWHDFENFYRDVGLFKPGKTLDRIDVNLGYSKENCRWADNETQANNKTNNVFIEANGKRLTISQWSRALNIELNTFRPLIYKYNFTVEDIISALTERNMEIRSPKDLDRQQIRKELWGYMINNPMTPSMISKETGLSQRTIESFLDPDCNRIFGLHVLLSIKKYLKDKGAS